MENAVDALKIAFAIVIFIFAFTALFQTATIARRTAEVLITETDKTTYYNYKDFENNQELAIIDQTYEDERGIQRVVKLEDIIPTIYRYSTESYGVTIIDNSRGNNVESIVARFDLQTEKLAEEWYSGTVTEPSKTNLMNEINKYVLAPVGAELLSRDPTTGDDDLKALFMQIYKEENVNPYLHPREFGCYWAYDEWVAQRIDSDLSR